MCSQISVVVCVKNRAKDLERALRSIKNQNGVLEIIVIDGGSTDKTLEIAKKFTDKIYSDKGRGLGFARQLGAEKASGRYMAFVDSDAELPKKDLLLRMVNEMEEKGWVAIHAQIVDPRINKTLWEYCQNEYYKNVTFGVIGETTFLGTIVCIIRREIILKYRFDPFMKYAMEDIDFWYRVGKCHKFGVSKEVAYHYHRISLKSFFDQMVWYGKGSARYMVKHKDWRWLIIPLARMPYGLLLAIKLKCIKCIPYHVIRSIGTLYGTVIGLMELKNEIKQKIEGENRRPFDRNFVKCKIYLE